MATEALVEHWWLTAPRTVERREEPLGSPGPGQVLVRVAWTAISPGSNVHVYRRGSWSASGGPVPEELLYMGSGVVETVGPDVTAVAAGDRVVASPGHQAAVVVGEGAVHRVPDELALREAAISYLCSWSVSVLHLGRYRAAETLVIIGQGLVGQSAALIADLMGARVLTLDVDPLRVAASSRLGAGRAVQVGAPGASETIAEALGPSGPDLIIETTGHWSGFRQAVLLARDYTRIAVMGIYRDPPPPDLALEIFGLLNSYPSKFHYKRLEIIGCGSDPDVVMAPAPHLATRSSNFAYTLEQAARGRLPLDRLITHTFAPSEVGAAFERLAGGDTSMVGVLFDWGLGRG